MIQYKTVQSSTQLPDKVFCNICGNEITFDGGISTHDYIHVDKTWGYCSDKDNQVHSFDICEPCYDNLIKTFKIKPTIIE